MRFSIVVPVYNVESYLPETLESMLAQSCSDYEVVLVDDGSTDGSPALCDGFRYSRKCSVKVIHQDNQGLLGARRAGILAAEGEYVISLDSDDLLRADALEKIDLAIDSTGADVVYYGFSRSRDFQPVEDFRMPPGILYSQDRARALFCETNRMNSMCKKAIARHCIGVDVDFSCFGRLNMGEDAIQSCVVLDRANSVLFLDESLYYYRPNAESISSNVTIAYLRDMQKVHETLLEHAKRWDSYRSDALCYKAMTARCVEELCHFVLHYASTRGYEESHVAINEVSNSLPISDCDPSYLRRFGTHTRLLYSLLKKHRLRAAWSLSHIASSLRSK